MLKKIDLMIVGAQKAGTTSLKNYLSEHPDIMSHPQIEFSFFNDDNEYNLGYDQIFNQYFDQKKVNANHKIVAKNVGICNNEVPISRLSEHNPACQIVFIIRKPVERAYSSYTMEVSNGWLKRDFTDIKQVIESQQYNDVFYRILVELGFYAAQLKTIYKYFPPEQVQVLLFEDLKTKSAKICSNIFSNLEVNADFKPNLKKVHNKTRQVKSSLISIVTSKLRDNDNVIKKTVKKILPPKLFTRLGYSLLEVNKSDKTFTGLDNDLRNFLISFYKPYNEDLQRLLGPEINISHWNE